MCKVYDGRRGSWRSRDVNLTWNLITPTVIPRVPLVDYYKFQVLLLEVIVRSTMLLVFVTYVR